MNNNSNNNLNNGYNYQKAYTPNKPIFNPFVISNDPINKGDLLHNNIDVNCENQYVSEYILHIDSADRTISKYQNPFCFNVIFNGSSDTKTITYEDKITYTNGKKNIEFNVKTEYITKGQPDPKIDLVFTGVKYIKLNHVILPDTNIVVATGLDAKPGLNQVQTVSSQYQLSTEKTDQLGNKCRFLILEIGGLQFNNLFSTNSDVNKNCFILYQDRTMGQCGHMWVPTTRARICPDSAPINIKNLTFKLMDDRRNQIFLKSQILINDVSSYEPTKLPVLKVDPSNINDNLIDSNSPINDNATAQMVIELCLGVFVTELATSTRQRF